MALVPFLKHCLLVPATITDLGSDCLLFYQHEQEYVLIWALFHNCRFQKKSTCSKSQKNFIFSCIFVFVCFFFLVCTSFFGFYSLLFFLFSFLFFKSLLMIYQLFLCFLCFTPFLYILYFFLMLASATHILIFFPFDLLNFSRTSLFLSYFCSIYYCSPSLFLISCISHQFFFP